MLDQTFRKVKKIAMCEKLHNKALVLVLLTLGEHSSPLLTSMFALPPFRDLLITLAQWEG